jgi:hypothetical protein
LTDEPIGTRTLGMTDRPAPLQLVRPAPQVPPRDPSAPQSLSGSDAGTVVDLPGGSFGAPAEWILRRAMYLSMDASGSGPAFFEQALADYTDFIRCRPVSWCAGESRLDPSARVYRATMGDPIGWWDLSDKLPFAYVATAAGRILSLRGFEDGDPGLPAATDEILARMTPWQDFAAERAIDIYERRIDVYAELGIAPPPSGSAERMILDEFFVDVVRAVVKPSKAISTERAYDVADVRHMAAGGVARALAWAALPVLSDGADLEADMEFSAQAARSTDDVDADVTWDAPAPGA